MFWKNYFCLLKARRSHNPVATSEALKNKGLAGLRELKHVLT
jgi:hypothetical protein